MGLNWKDWSCNSEHGRSPLNNSRNIDWKINFTVGILSENKLANIHNLDKELEPVFKRLLTLFLYFFNNCVGTLTNFLVCKSGLCSISESPFSGKG